ncbi:MAG: RsmB/NOP family class I SAM-dependent RNA methyltransferase, partial [Candidatus Levyibacteriota bacterium]
MNEHSTLPEKLVDRLQELYSEKELQQVLKTFAIKSLPSFRVNTIKPQASDIEISLKTQGFTIEKVLWYPDAFVLQNKSIRELTETEEYKNGLLYIQNLSSMLPALILDPQENDYILDIAAAPGSKTTQIAALMNNTGDIVANDISPKRLYKLKDNLSQMGVTNVRVVGLRGESFWKRYPELFDRTLVDVPCSMEGRIRIDDPKTYKDWSTKKIKQLSKLQKYMLRSAISATKIGGTIVYSSCTLSPEENEEVIEWIVSKTPDALIVEKIILPNVPLAKGLLSWKKKTFMHTANTARVLPSDSMEGFFVAKLHKIASTLPAKKK